MNSAPIRIELPTPFAVGPVNCFLLLDPEPTLIDCGMKIEMNQTALKAGLAQHGLTIADLKRIVITHAHVDHMGMAAWLCEQSDAMVWVSDLVEPWARDIETMWNRRIRIYRPILNKIGLDETMQKGIVGYMRSVPNHWDSIPDERLMIFDHEGELEMGGMSWEVLHLPGHTIHQSGFYQREMGWLISADCLLHRTPVPILEHNPDNPTERNIGFPIHLQSLNRINRLDIQIAFPGHGKLIHDHRALIAKQFARIEQRKSECEMLIKAGNHTLPVITDVMYGHYPPSAKFTGLSTILGYTDLLIAEGKIEQVEKNGIWHYFPV